MKDSWTWTRRGIAIALVAVWSLTLFGGSTAAAPRTKPNLSFFTGGSGTAGWTASDPGSDLDSSAIALGVPGVSPPDFAGVEIKRAGASAPATEPSFKFKSSVFPSASGGSPRLVLLWTDGTSELRPLTWSTTYQTVGGAGLGDWDNNGGTCGFLFATTYTATVACHASATLVAVFIVTDSGWLVNPYTHFIDEISYGGFIFTSPKDNAN